MSFRNESVLNVANAVYGVWAKYRMEITGREALNIILERRTKLAVSEQASKQASERARCHTSYCFV